MKVLAFLFIISNPCWAQIAPVGSLDQKLERLYQNVQQKFQANPWFRNSADENLTNSILGNGGHTLPDFSMPSMSFFKTAMKSYCSLLEADAKLKLGGKKKQIQHPEHYLFANYSNNNLKRSLYVYDVRNQAIIHNLWLTYGKKTSLTQTKIRLSDVGVDGDDDDLTLFYDEPWTAEFFSNVKSSNESSVGMAYTEEKTYYSNEFNSDALKLHGVDGSLNNNLFARGIVAHAWSYNASNVIYQNSLPASSGCLMLPDSGFYFGRPDQPIAELVIHDIFSVPVMLYHERMDHPDLNEKAHHDQLALYQQFENKVNEMMGSFAGKYDWDAIQLTSNIQKAQTWLSDHVLNRIEDTYRYFKTPSPYIGKAPASESACAAALGI